MNKLALIEAIVLPNSSLKVMLRLAQALKALLPKETSAVVEVAASKLGVAIARAEQALTARLRDYTPELLANEMLFDRAVDCLWVWLRRMLEDCANWEHEGLDLLPEKLALETNLAALRKRAARARKLHERLFGADGSLFVRLSYIEQSVSMAALLRLIEEDGLGDELEAVVGVELSRMLAACQIHYEAMVDGRLTRERNTSEDLRVLRVELRILITRYRNALSSWADEDKPETVEVAWNALLPMIKLRSLLAKPGRRNEDEQLTLLESFELEEANADADAPEPDAPEPEDDALLG